MKATNTSSSKTTSGVSISRAINQKQFQKVWNQTQLPPTTTTTEPTKKVRIFNKPGNKTLNKIYLDDHTWVDYDYEGEGTIKLNTGQNDIPKDTFILPKYPILRAVKRSIPEVEENKFKDRDMFIITDIKETLIWNAENASFDFHQ